MRKLISTIARYISIQNQYTKDEEEQIEYALKITIFETIKLIGANIVFVFIGYPVQATTTVITMMITKPFIGGYHEETQFKCFIATLLIVAGVTYLSINLEVNFVSKLVLYGISLFSIWHQAPVINPKMLLTNPKLIKRNRLLGVSITVILILVSLAITDYTTISNAILWTTVFQALLLFNKKTLA